MSADDLERYETEVELELYREYRQVAGRFEYVVETERRHYLANEVDVTTKHGDNGEVFFEVRLRDAWVWDMYRSDRSIGEVTVLTFRDVNVERLPSAGQETSGESRPLDG
ncbi:MAG: DUF2469 family protein [Candidatus Nanopelagicales bacterium]|nr:DUF2469 family protein [Candidatus Nanopelagicales bacterium]